MEKIIAAILLGIGAFVAAAFVIVVIGLLISWPVMLLWNGCLVGTVAGITAIHSIWQAWGILILCGLLFRSSK